MSRGFSLIELVFALLLLQVGILGTSGLILLAQRDMLRAELTLRATLETSRVADSLSGSGAEGSGQLDFPWGSVSWAPASGTVGDIQAVAISASSGDTLAISRAWTVPLPTIRRAELPATVEGGSVP